MYARAASACEALDDLLQDVLEGRRHRRRRWSSSSAPPRPSTVRATAPSATRPARWRLMAIRGFRDDFEHHIRYHSCGFEGAEQPVPCVSGCPAHVDIPGYIALVEAGRYADAVEAHPQGQPAALRAAALCASTPARCTAAAAWSTTAVNIRGLKRYAVEHMRARLTDRWTAPCHRQARRHRRRRPSRPLRAPITSPSWATRSTIFEQRKQLGGMLRYGIPSYRLPRRASSTTRSACILARRRQDRARALHRHRPDARRASPRLRRRLPRHRRPHRQEARPPGRGQPRASCPQ